MRGSVLTVRVEPRVELIQTVMYLTGKQKETEQTSARHPYVDCLLAWFGAMAESDAVLLASQFIDRNFRHVKPNRLVMGLSLPPELEEMVGPRQYIEESESSIEQSEGELQGYIDALRRFATDSRFMEFFQLHKAFYRELETYLMDAVGDTVIGELEAYFGSRLHSYTLIGSPLCGNYGFQLEASGDAYCISMLPRLRKDGVTGYPSAESTVNTAKHEFGHCFVNNLTYAHMQAIQSLDRLKAAHQSTAYNWWPAIVNETLIRACQARFFAAQPDMGLRELGDAWKADPRQEWLKLCEESMGFILVREAEQLLESYESNRRDYPTFQSFYPVILEWLQKRNA